MFEFHLLHQNHQNIFSQYLLFYFFMTFSIVFINAVTVHLNISVFTCLGHPCGWCWSQLFALPPYWQLRGTWGVWLPSDLWNGCRGIYALCVVGHGNISSCPLDSPSWNSAFLMEKFNGLSILKHSFLSGISLISIIGLSSSIHSLYPFQQPCLVLYPT